MGAIDWLLLLTLSVLWGGSFLFAKIALAEVPPLTLVLLRVVIAAAALHLLVRAAGLSMAVGWPLWAACFGMALLNNVIPFSLIFWGQQWIGARRHSQRNHAAVHRAGRPCPRSRRKGEWSGPRRRHDRAGRRRVDDRP
jgi:hypothetical protein